VFKVGGAFPLYFQCHLVFKLSDRSDDLSIRVSVHNFAFKASVICISK